MREPNNYRKIDHQYAGTVRKMVNPIRLDMQQKRYGVCAGMIQDKNSDGALMQMPKVESRTGFRRSFPLQWSNFKTSILSTISNFPRRYYITSPIPVDPLALHPTIVINTTFLPSFPYRQPWWRILCLKSVITALY
jgi:hypothetical protein